MSNTVVTNILSDESLSKMKITASREQRPLSVQQFHCRLKKIRQSGTKKALSAIFFKVLMKGFLAPKSGKIMQIFSLSKTYVSVSAHRQILGYSVNKTFRLEKLISMGFCSNKSFACVFSKDLSRKKLFFSKKEEIFFFRAATNILSFRAFFLKGTINFLHRNEGSRYRVINRDNKKWGTLCFSLF